MQNNKNGGRVRLKDIQNMLAKDFNIHYQNINGVHYLLTKLPNSEQFYKGKVQTHNYINRQNQSTTGKL
jgi:hypothetical protein